MDDLVEYLNVRKPRDPEKPRTRLSTQSSITITSSSFSMITTPSSSSRCLLLGDRRRPSSFPRFFPDPPPATPFAEAGTGAPLTRARLAVVTATGSISGEGERGRLSVGFCFFGGMGRGEARMSDEPEGSFGLLGGRVISYLS
jgi:hypothetical protein